MGEMHYSHTKAAQPELWSCHLVAFEIVTSKMGIGSAATQIQLKAALPHQDGDKTAIRQSVCSQFAVEWGQSGNHMQSVWVNTSINCDKLAKTSNLFAATYIAILLLLTLSTSLTGK